MGSRAGSDSGWLCVFWDWLGDWSRYLVLQYWLFLRFASMDQCSDMLPEDVEKLSHGIVALLGRRPEDDLLYTGIVCALGI